MHEHVCSVANTTFRTHKISFGMAIEPATFGRELSHLNKLGYPRLEHTHKTQLNPNWRNKVFVGKTLQMKRVVQSSIFSLVWIIVDYTTVCEVISGAMFPLIGLRMRNKEL